MTSYFHLPHTRKRCLSEYSRISPPPVWVFFVVRGIVALGCGRTAAGLEHDGDVEAVHRRVHQIVQRLFAR